MLDYLKIKILILYFWIINNYFKIRIFFLERRNNALRERFRMDMEDERIKREIYENQ